MNKGRQWHFRTFGSVFKRVKTYINFVTINSLNNLYAYNLVRYYYHNNNLLLFSYSLQFEKPFIQYFQHNLLKITSFSANAFA